MNNEDIIREWEAKRKRARQKRHYETARDYQIGHRDARVVGQARSGRLFHIAIVEYDASTYPHPGPKDPYSACNAQYPLVVNVTKYLDLIRNNPIETIEFCSRCLRLVRPPWSPYREAL